MNKEEVYDAQISPLMAQIIAICHAHKIAKEVHIIANLDKPYGDA